MMLNIEANFLCAIEVRELRWFWRFTMCTETTNDFRATLVTRVALMIWPGNSTWSWTIIIGQLSSIIIQYYFMLIMSIWCLIIQSSSSIICIINYPMVICEWLSHNFHVHPWWSWPSARAPAAHLYGCSPCQILVTLGFSRWLSKSLLDKTW